MGGGGGDSIGSYIHAMIHDYFNKTGKPETQEIVGNTPNLYAVDVRRNASTGKDITGFQLPIITPYAGDNYGLVCTPRPGQLVLAVPGRNKHSSYMAVGRMFMQGERVPVHDVGDFLIRHETQSALLFKYAQPAISEDGFAVGDSVTLTENLEASSLEKRVFDVEITNKTEKPPIIEGDFISVLLSSGVPDGDSAPAQGQDQGIRVAWMVPVQKKKDKDSFQITIDRQSLVFGANPVDYLSADPNDFIAMRVTPMKGFVEFSHYTGSRVFADEYMNFKLLKETDKKPTRYNINAVVGKKVFNENGKCITKHTRKGKFVAEHYTESGLQVVEKEVQTRGQAVQLFLQLQKLTPRVIKPGTIPSFQLPNCQFLLEDISQDIRDVATQAKLRQISSAVIDDKCTEDSPKSKKPVLKFLEIDKHYGIDNAHKVKIRYEGSGFVVDDFLRQYVEGEGWKFVTHAEAEAQYRGYDDEYYKASKNAGKPPEGDKGEYEIKYKERILPASGRRDIMMKREDTRKVPLVSEQWEKLEEENKAFLGQSGYNYKTDWDDPFLDGHLCVPKGGSRFEHYTRSGIDVREIDPDLDYHAMFAAFSLFNWDMGQYHTGHEFSEKRDEKKMTFGPYPLPLGRLVMESAKIESEDGTKVIIPTQCVTHTEHPQKGFLEDGTVDESKRKTVAILGETASWLGIEHDSTRIQSVIKDDDAKFDDERIPSWLLFKDYVIHAIPSDKKTPLISAAKWKNKRGKKRFLIAPKGAVELQNYTTAGLRMYDQKLSYLNKYKGGHSMATELTCRSINFLGKTGDSEEPPPLFKKSDGKLFIKMISNERVDLVDYVYEVQDRKVEEEGSVRGKQAQDPHGKRGAMTGYMHMTTMARAWKEPCQSWYEDCLLKTSSENESEAGTKIPAHIYEPKEPGEERVLVMPKGRGGMKFYTKSGLYMGDAESGEDVSAAQHESPERGKKHRPFTHVYMQQWNNRKIDNPKGSPAKPYQYPSATVNLDTLAKKAPYEGEDASRIAIDLWSSTIKTEKHGTSMIMKDFTKGGGMADIASPVFSFFDGLAGGLTGASTGAIFLSPSVRTVSNEENISLVDSSITEVFVSDTPDGAMVSWETEYDGDSCIQISEDPKFVDAQPEPTGEPSEAQGITVHDPKLTKTHTVLVKGLDSDKTYYAKVTSTVFSPLTENTFSPYETEATTGEGGDDKGPLNPEGEATSPGGWAPFAPGTEFPIPWGSDDDIGEQSCHGYQESGAMERKKLCFPKGQTDYMLYNKSGLFMEDLQHEPLERQEVRVRLSMREWDNSAPEEHGEPFPEDSVHLNIIELCPDAPKDGKRASQTWLHGLTSWAKAAEFGNSLIFEDFKDGNMPAHIFGDGGGKGMKKPKFPKAKIDLKHYTKSGLYLWDEQQTGADKHEMRVHLRLRQWDEDKPEDKDLAWIYAEDTTPKKDELAVQVGFLLYKHMTEKKCGNFFIKDHNTKKDEHKIECAIYHWEDASFFKIIDKEEQGDEGKKDVLAHLQHHKKAGLKIENTQDDVKVELYHHKQSEENPAKFHIFNQGENVTIDHHHFNDAGYKVENQGGQTTLTIYHASGSSVVIDPEGKVTVTGVKDVIVTAEGNIKAESQQNVEVTAGQEAKVTASTIKLSGEVTIDGMATINGNVKVNGTVTAQQFITG